MLQKLLTAAYCKVFSWGSLGRSEYEQEAYLRHTWGACISEQKWEWSHPSQQLIPSRARSLFAMVGRYVSHVAPEAMVLKAYQSPAHRCGRLRKAGIVLWRYLRVRIWLPDSDFCNRVTWSVSCTKLAGIALGTRPHKIKFPQDLIV